MGGYGGIYDIKLDGKMIYSRDQQNGRFPKKGEVVDLIKAQMGAAGT